MLFSVGFFTKKGEVLTKLVTVTFCCQMKVNKQRFLAYSLHRDPELLFRKVTYQLLQYGMCFLILFFSVEFFMKKREF